MSWDFVQAWTRAPDQDVTIEGRGWTAGRTRHHPADLRARIVAIRQQLVADPDEYYIGDLAVQQRYAARYPHDPLPEVKYIGEILRVAGCTRPHQPRRRGGARYLCYPVACIQRLGHRIAEADFIGQKYLRGVSAPLHFLSIAYQRPARLRRIYRTLSETTAEAITVTARIFRELGWPDVVRVDAGLPFTGRGERADGRGARSIPQYAAFLLRSRIVPVFGAIRQPWNQAYVEGSNSVFGRNFWRKHTFVSPADVDARLDAFNRCSKTYANWQPWRRTSGRSSFLPRIGFIRRVEADAREQHGVIPVASTLVTLPKTYIGLFVFAHWNLSREVLHVYFEREQSMRVISTVPFPIHPTSKKRCTDFIT